MLELASDRNAETSDRDTESGVDALSSVLRTVRISGGLFFRVLMRPPFAVTSLPAAEVQARFAPRADHVLPFHLVTSGRFWFVVEDEPPVELGAGDLIVLPRGSTHVLTDRPGRGPIPVTDLDDQISGVPPTLVHGGEGPSNEALCGFFTARGKTFNPLLEALPTVLVARHDSEGTPWLVATAQKTFAEMAGDRPGRHAAVERLTESLFVDVVRRHVAVDEVGGWLRGLRDPVVARALDLLHADPSHPWSVEELARRSGASRSSLGERFAATVGRSPMRYLAAWRIELAAERLLHGTESVAEIAAEVGYDSETAFGRAFKRHVGVSPREWRRERKLARPFSR